MKYKFPIYSTQTTVMIEENTTPGQDMLEGFSVRPGVSNLDNQILVLSSYLSMRNLSKFKVEGIPKINEYGIPDEKKRICLFPGI